MTRLALSFAFILAFGGICVAVSESEQHGHNEHHEHPVEEDGSDSFSYDHEVFLGSRKLVNEFADLSSEEALSRLLTIAKTIDKNGDGLISKDELSSYLSKNFLNLDEEAAAERMPNVDTNNDGFIDLPEHVKATYNTDIENLEGLVHNETAMTDPNVKNAVKSFLLEKSKFELADVNGDKKLSLSEYTAFTHPYDFDHMLPIEVKQTMETYDMNGDGKISMQEFLNDGESGGDEDWRRQEAERFTKELDKNSDGFLDESEVTVWVSPSLKSTSDEEAEHILRLLDTDKDGQLNEAEITAGRHMLVGSADDGEHDHSEL